MNNMSRSYIDSMVAFLRKTTKMEEFHLVSKLAEKKSFDNRTLLGNFYFDLYVQKSLKVIEITDVSDETFLTASYLNSFLTDPVKANLLVKISSGVMDVWTGACDFINLTTNLKHLELNGLSGHMDYLIKVGQASTKLQYFGSHDFLTNNDNLAEFIKEKQDTLKEVYLPNYKCSNSDISSLSLCQKLEGLSLDCRSVTRAIISKIPENKHLERLYLRLSITTFSPSDLSLFFCNSNMSKLTSLHLFYETFNDDILKNISKCKALKHLHLESILKDRSRVTSEGFLHISENCRCLEKLTLQFSSISYLQPELENIFLKQISSLPNIEFVCTKFLIQNKNISSLLGKSQKLIAWLEASKNLYFKSGTPDIILINAFGAKALENIKSFNMYKF